jgi:hypothetical protein
VSARASSEPTLRKPELAKPILKEEEEAPEALSKAEAHSPATYALFLLIAANPCLQTSRSVLYSRHLDVDLAVLCGMTSSVQE